MEVSNEKILTAVIVDDETGSIETMVAMLERYCPEVKVLKTFEYANEAIHELPLIAPDLLFLDVEMPETDGFQLLDALKEQLRAEVVFTTAYPQYAVRAIEYAAMHYLVKPIEADKLKAALARYRAWHNTDRDNETRFRVLLENRGKKPEEQALVFDAVESKIQPVENDTTLKVLSTSTLKVKEGNLLVQDREKMNVVKLEQIIHLLAVGGYTMIYHTNGTQIVATRTLARFEELLTGDGMPFFRIHESYIVNRKYIKSYTLGEDPTIEVEHTKNRIPLARRRKKAFKEWMLG